MVEHDGAPRRSNPDEVERLLEARILALLDQRGPGKTICPSEAARAVHVGQGHDERSEGWRELMGPARRAAGRLVATGAVEMTQGGEVVDPQRASGPVRLRRAR